MRVFRAVEDLIVVLPALNEILLLCFILFLCLLALVLTSVESTGFAYSIVELRLLEIGYLGNLLQLKELVIINRFERVEAILVLTVFGMIHQGTFAVAGVQSLVEVLFTLSCLLLPVLLINVDLALLALWLRLHSLPPAAKVSR